MSLSLLFSSAFLSSTLLPGGSEAVLVYMVREGVAAPLMLWAVASLGNILGGVSGWLLGWWLARTTGGRRIRANRSYRRASMRLRRWGSPALLLSWLPVIGDPLCVAAGWLRVGFFSALAFIAAGKAVRYGVLVYVAMPAP
jgi:membrane protein YqaA with SNARE-associated domain